MTVAAEDTFDACPSCTASPPRPCWSPVAETGTTRRSCSGRRPRPSPNGRLRLYPGKGHAGVLTHRPAIREIVSFLRADDQPRA
jgi:hypothetical protein